MIITVGATRIFYVDWVGEQINLGRPHPAEAIALLNPIFFVQLFL
ncbi:MAG TPA: hypothetical protein V6D30_23225 [Leptolyngbyaceae cyanobacterium]